jgi:PAS domain S-box-containing protein
MVPSFLKPFAFLAVVLTLPLSGQEARDPRPIVVGVNRDFPPFEFLDASGEPAGYNVDLIKAVAEQTELTLAFHVDSWDNIKAGLASGSIDVAPGMLYSQERAAFVDFTAPHLVVHYCLFLRRGARKVTSMEDLRGRRILVERGSRMDEYLVAKGFGAERVPVESEPEALRRLSEGLGADAAALPRLVGLEMIQQLGLTNIQPMPGSVLSEVVCFGVARNRGLLRANLDSGLAIVNRTGRYREIYDRWLGALEPRQGLPPVLRKALLTASAGILLLAGIVLAWTWALRRKVRERTEELATSETRYRLAMEATNDGIWDWEIPSGQVHYSPGYIRMLGFEEGEWDRRVETWSDMIHPDDRERVLKANQDCIDGTIPAFEVEYRLRARSGEWKWIYARARAVEVDANHRATRLVGTHVDITRRKETEAQRKRLQEELDHLHKLDSLGRLAGGVAHDMNNVLGAILAVVDTLRLRAGRDKDLEGAHATIERAALRGRDLVKGLLAFTRKDLASPERLDLNELVRQEAALLDRTLLKKFELVLDLEEDAAPIQGERGALGSALMNLCVNAVDAMPDGGRLTLRTRRGADGTVDLSVEDTGQGMSPEVLGRAMEPFFTTKPGGKGTGLGLAMAFTTARAHGGTLTLRSQPGQGTCATLTLPLHRGEAPGEPAPEASRAPKGLRILLVDDEELVRVSIPGLLQAMGHRVEAVDGGPAALASLESRVPDLVILDLNMPGMNGMEVLARLRAGHPELPVVLASGYLEPSVLAALEADPHALPLQKPFSRKDIQERILQVLQT